MDRPTDSPIKGVVVAPNEMMRGLGITRSATPAATVPGAHSPDYLRGSAAPGGSGSLARTESPVFAPNHGFDVDNAKMGQPPSAITPGQGAIPVDLRVGRPAFGIARIDTPKK